MSRQQIDAFQKICRLDHSYRQEIVAGLVLIPVERQEWSTYLLQHLKGEARRAVKGFSNDDRGYVLYLKRFKFLKIREN